MKPKIVLEPCWLRFRCLVL